MKRSRIDLQMLFYIYRIADDRQYSTVNLSYRGAWRMQSVDIIVAAASDSQGDPVFA